MVKNPLTSAGDQGLIPGPGRHCPMPQSNISPCAQLPSLCPRISEPELLSPCSASAEARVPQSLCSSTRETAAVRSLSTTTQRRPCSLQLEKCLCSSRDPGQPKEMKHTENLTKRKALSLSHSVLATLILSLSPHPPHCFLCDMYYIVLNNLHKVINQPWSYKKQKS